MSTEQIREEFERTMRKRLGSLIDFTRNTRDDYIKVDTAVAWISWQDSRSALVISIVQHTEFEIEHIASPREEKDTYAIGWIDGRNYAAKQVSAAGITVKE